MKHLFLFLMLLTGLVAQAQQTAQPVDGTDCSNLFFKALVDEDAKKLGALLSNDFTVTSFDGQIIDGARLQEAVAQGYIVVHSGMLNGTNTRLYGDVAVVTGQWSLSAKIADNNFQGQLAYMSVCVKSGGVWKISALQLTPLR